MEELFLQWMMFVILMALGQFSPGPDMILLTRVALADGLKAGCAVAGGIASGLTIHAGIALCLIDRLSAWSSNAGGNLLILSITILAMLYLSWLSYNLLTSAFVGYYSGSKFEIERDEYFQQLSVFQHYRRGLLCNLLNPKVAIFLAGVVLPFQQMATGSLSWLMILWLTIVLEGLLLWCCWVRLLQAKIIRTWYTKYVYWIDGLFGVALLVLVILLGVDILRL